MTLKRTLSAPIAPRDRPDLLDLWDRRCLRYLRCLVAVSLVLGLTGCGAYIGAGLAISSLSGSGGGGGGGAAAEPSTPQVQSITLVSDPEGAGRPTDLSAVAVDVAVSDTDGKPVTLTLEVRAADEPGGALQELSSLTRTREQVRTASQGRVERFTLDLLAAGLSGLADCEITVTASDGVRTGEPASTARRTIGNEPPVVFEDFQITPGVGNQGTITLDFRIDDPRRDPCSVTIEFKPVAAPDSDFRPIDLSVGSTTGLASDGSGLTVGWNSLAAPGPPGVQSGIGLANQEVVFRISVDDGLPANGPTSPAITTGTFVIMNNQSSLIRVDAVRGVGTGTPETLNRVAIGEQAEIAFTLFNPEGSAETVAVTATALIAGVSSEALDNPRYLRPGATADSDPRALIGSAMGESYLLRWDSIAQLDSAAVTDIVVELTPTDSFAAGTLGRSSPFVSGNDAPQIAIAPFEGPRSGNPIFTVSLIDSTFDLIDLEFSFFIDGSLQPLPDPAVSPVANLVSSAMAGLATDVTWNARLDFTEAPLMSPIDRNRVRVAVTPRDAFGGPAGPTVMIPEFQLLSLDQRPSVRFPAFGREDASPVTFQLQVTDDEGGDVRLDALCFEVGVAGFANNVLTTNLAAGFVVTDTNVPDNAVTVVWDAAADLGPGLHEDVRLKAEFTDLGSMSSFTELMSEDERFLVGNDPPVLRELVLNNNNNGSAGGGVPITFRLFDSSSDPTRVNIEFRLAAEPDSAFRPIALQVGTLNQLATSSVGSGEPQSVGWDSLSATGGIGLANDGVVFRLTPVDSFAGGVGTPVTSTPIAISNNDPPIVTVQPVPRATINEPIAIPFRLFNSEGGSDPIGVTAEFSVAGGTWTPMLAPTVIDTAPVPATLDLSSLTGSPMGIDHVLLWNATAQLPAAATTDVVARLTAADGSGIVNVGLSLPFTTGNDASEIQIDPLSDPQSGEVIFNFLLLDSTETSVDVNLTFSVASIGVIASPTLAPSSTSSLPASPVGVPTRIAWTAPADFASLNQAINNETVTVTLTPDDGLGSALETETLQFTLVSDDNQPQVEIELFNRNVNAVETISLRIQDKEGSPIQITGLQFTHDGLSGDQPLTLVDPSLIAQPVTTIPMLPVAVALDWDLMADLGANGRIPATTGLRVTVNGVDTVSLLPFAKSVASFNAITYGNDAPELDPVIDVIGDSGNVVVRYTLSDSTADRVDLVPEFQLVSGGAIQPIDSRTIVGGLINDLPAVVAPGRTIDFTWNTRETLGGTVQQAIAAAEVELVVRLTPRDKFGVNGALSDTGQTVESAPFTIRNNSKPIATIEFDQVQDLRGPVPVPFTLRDAESDPVEVLVQWKSQGQATFPDLNDPALNPFVDPASGRFVADSVAIKTVRDALLADPATRRRLQILTEVPRTIESYVSVGSDSSTIIAGDLSGRMRRLDFSGARARVGARDVELASFDSGRSVLTSPLSPPPQPGETFAVDRRVLGRSLAAGPSATRHVLVWDVGADVVAPDQQLRLRLTPFDQGNVGDPAASVTDRTVTGLLSVPSLPSLMTGKALVAVEALDFDRDGLEDLVALASDGLVYYQQLSGGLRSVATPLITTPGLRDFKVADLNNDTRNDVIVINAAGDEVQLYLQQTNGTFLTMPSRVLVSGSTFTAVAAGAVDNNSLVDILVADSTNQSVLVFIQESAGGGAFPATPTQSLTNGTSPRELVFEDLTGDVFPDLVVLNSSGTVTIYTKAGDGLFPTSPTGSPAPTAAAVSVAVGDFNGDDRPDLSVSTTVDTVDLFLQSGGSIPITPTSSLPAGAAPTQLTAVDLNGDQLVDLLTVNDGDATLGVYLQSGTGLTLIEAIPNSVSRPTGVTVGRLSSSRALIVAVASDQGDVGFSETNPAGLFPSTPTLSRRPIASNNFVTAQAFAADLNNDGLDDYVAVADSALTTANTFTNVEISFQSPAGAPAPNASLQVSVFQPGRLSTQGVLAIGDLNSDGRNDLAMANGGTLFVFFQRADGVYPALADLSVLQNHPKALEIADVNNDGRQDLVAVPLSGSAILVYFQNSNGTLDTNPLSIQVGSTSTGVRVLDMNQDGRADVMALQPTQALVFLQNSSGGFPTTPSMTLPPVAVPSIRSGDFNSDGRLDQILVPTTGIAGELQIFLQD